MAGAGIIRRVAFAIEQARADLRVAGPSEQQIMWHAIWHVIVGLGLGIVGALWVFLFFIMSIFSTDAGKINSMTFGTWAIGALGLIPVGLGGWLLLTI